MALRRRWFLVLTVFALGAGTARAGFREERDFNAAKSAFQDHLWAQAETAFASFVRKHTGSPRIPEALVLEAQAQFRQGKFTDALTLLTTQKTQAATLADQFDYWLGEVQAAMRNYPAATATFLALPQHYPASPLRLRATVEAAAALAADHHWDQVARLLADPAGGFVSEANQRPPADDLVVRGRLLLAEARTRANDFSEAARELSRLTGPLADADLEWQRLHLLARLKLGAGEPAAVLDVASNALQQALAAGQTGRAATNRETLATAQEQLGHPAAAAALWRDNLANGVPPEAQGRAVARLAALAGTPEERTNTEAALAGFLALNPAPAAAQPAQVALGELQLQDYTAGPGSSNGLASARAQFARVLADTNSPLAGRAWLGLGWCHWLAGQTNDCGADFLHAVQALTATGGDPQNLALAQFKSGDAAFLLGDFVTARDRYRAARATMAGIAPLQATLGPRALYQILRADLNLQPPDRTDADRVLNDFLAVYPRSELTDRSQLLAGEKLSDFGQPVAARAVLNDCLKLFPDSPNRPAVELAVAHTYETEQNWPELRARLAAWLQAYPTNALRVRVEFARAQADALAGDETNALARFNAFLTRNPGDALAPRAQWWVADYYFRATTQAGSENYVAAETNYENIFQSTNSAWMTSPLYYPAQLMAGRAAMGRLGYSDACGYFVKLLGDTNCPPEVAVPARFAYGAALMQTPPADTNTPLANFQLATNIFAQVCHLCPTNDTGARAWGEIGNCAAQLGDFSAATNAYLQALNLPAAGTVTRNQAEVGLALTLEKFADPAAGTNSAALRRQALDHYYSVFADPDNDPFWRREAGVHALALLPQAGLPPETSARLITHLEEVFPQLTAPLEKKKAALAPPKPTPGI